MGKKILNKELLYHVMGIIGFLAIPIVFSPDFFSPVELTQIKGFRNDLAFHILLVLYFYFSYLVLLDKLYFKGRYVLYVLVITICFVSFVYIADVISGVEHQHRPDHQSMEMPSHHGHEHPHHQPHFHIFELGKHFIQFVMLTILSILIGVNQRRKRLEQEKTDLELSYLKSKLNPHFLFNTLNGIYALSLEKSDKTASAIVKLSGMMRYLLTEAERKEVSLKNELDYIKDYIELQKLRLTENNQLNVTVTGYPNGKKITPMILMTFIENAFKYGVNPEKDSRIDIGIKLENNSIILNVFNTKSRATNSEDEDGGRGLSHTLKILETRYSGHYILETEDGADAYRVYLKIDIEN